MKKTALIILSILALTGCTQNSKIDQSKMCIISTDSEVKKCKSGELVLFKPSRWGSEQLPLGIAGAYCDFNYQIMHNNSGLICVYTDKRLSLIE